jgi:hypothetical protein
MKIRTMSLTNLWMPGAGRLAAMLALALIACLAPNSAQAQTCHSMLQDHVNWAISEGDDARLDFTMVSIFGQKATFAEGTLTHGWGVFSGTGTHYFSARRWGFPDPDPDSFNPNPYPYPFNPNQTDNVRVSLNAYQNTVSVQLENGSSTFDLKCDHQALLHSVTPPGWPGWLRVPMYVISLKRWIAPPSPE